ncbi:MAG: hypothetical protein SOY13_00510, partial [Pseudoflavonifractor sp.]|nr:hypothetical protein [Pseudoflavonifractor sp.]
LFVCLKVLLKSGGNKKDSRQAVSFRGGDKRDRTAVVCLPESALKTWWKQKRQPSGCLFSWWR